jgi:cytochrome c-type biogenesis protein CcmF
MDYPGEHLLPGQLGHFFIVLSLTASLVATFAYFKATLSKNEIDKGYWKKLARYAFITETVSVAAIFSALFYIISNHLFEYKYAWQHSSRSLEPEYMLACFWEGQEGSFLLWSFWHCVLGLVLIRTGKQWEAPVMTVVSFAQLCLATMVAGIYVVGEKIGSNPFILMRDSGIFDNAPGMHVDFNLANPIRPDYLSLPQMQDGNDLNPLLQNYWMVIHPPILFLGFASAIVPFAFAIAGLWKKKFGEWVQAALPWALFATAVLGVGIMMGAAWAYESLNFGGYWAWDPVENASLVPWLVLVSGIHTMLIYKHSGFSLRATFIFFIIAFWLILYSTFLTRSGILGETSVHAFTDLGMNIQLYMFMYLLIWLPGIIAAKDRTQQIYGGIIATLLLPLMYFANMPWLGLLSLLGGILFTIYQVLIQVKSMRDEENGTSREFWMFIGSLVFFLSAVVIIAQTSTPVVNKVFGFKLAPPEDAEFSYNRIQVFVAIIISLLTAVVQYLKYKATSVKYFLRKITWPTIISVVLASLILGFGHINYEKKTIGFMAAIWVAVACSVYALIANAGYIWIGLKGKLKLSGGSISHMGFAMVLLGILISSSKKEILSNNINGIPVPLAETENPAENLTLVQGVRTKLGKYWVTYEKETSNPKKPKSYFHLRFLSKDGKEKFVLKPNAFVNYKMQGLSANPDAKRYWDHDVFVYITSMPDPAKKQDSVSSSVSFASVGDTIFYSGGYIVLQAIKNRDSLPEDLFGKNGKLFEAPLKIYSKTGSVFSVTPKLAIAKGQNVAVPDSILQENLVLQLEDVDKNNRAKFLLKESRAIMKYVTLKAYKFPFINLLWAGVIITAIGIFISMTHRIQQNRAKYRKTGF